MRRNSHRDKEASLSQGAKSLRPRMSLNLISSLSFLKSKLEKTEEVKMAEVRPKVDMFAGMTESDLDTDSDSDSDSGSDNFPAVPPFSQNRSCSDLAWQQADGVLRKASANLSS